MTIDSQKQARDASFLTIGQILSALSEAIIPIVLVRFLSFNEVGILSTVLLIYTIIAPVLTSAFPSILMYYMPTCQPAQRKGIVVKVAQLLLLLGFAGGSVLFSLGLVAVLFPLWLSGVTDHVVGGVSAIGPSGLKYLMLLALLPIGDFPARILPNLLIIENRPGTAAVVGIVKSVGTLIFIIIPTLLDLSLWAIIGSYTLFGLGYVTILLHYLRSLYPEVMEQPPSGLPTTRQIFRFALPLGITETVMMLYNKVDQLLVATAFTAALVAQYKIGAWQIPLITTIAYSVGSVYAPHIRKLLVENRGKEAIAMWRLSIDKVSLLIVPLSLVFAVGAEETIELLFTQDYLGGANVFRLYCLVTLGRVAAFGPVLVAAGRPGLIFRVAVLSFFANILLSIAGMHLIGLEGPAVGTLLAFILHVTLFCWCIGKALGIHFTEVFPLKRYLQVLSAGLLAGGCAWWFKVSVVLTPGCRLMGIAVILITLFAGIGTISGLIQRQDWLFLLRLIRSDEKKQGKGGMRIN